MADPWRPPDLGAGRFRLTFDVPLKLRSWVTADPVIWVPGEPPPIASLTPHPFGWYPAPNGTFFPQHDTRGVNALVPYVQVTRPLDDPDLGPGFEFADFEMLAPGSPAAGLLRMQVPEA